MDLLVDEQKQIFDVAVEDILKERGSAICLTDARALWSLLFSMERKR